MNNITELAAQMREIHALLVGGKTKEIIEKAAVALEAAQAEIERLKGNADAAIAFCPTCSQGVTTSPDMTRDEVIFHCGRSAGRLERDILKAEVAAQSEQVKRWMGLQAASQTLAEAAQKSRDAALARLAEIERQEPVAQITVETNHETKRRKFDFEPLARIHDGISELYAAAGASPEPSALQAANDELITALAACRDAFPVPDAGSRLDDWYCSAMADPLAVPDYVKACVGASPVQPSQAWLSYADVWANEEIMALNAEAGLEMSLLMKIVRAAINAKGAV